MGKKYYAVKVGRIPGIYQTWDETKEISKTRKQLIINDLKNKVTINLYRNEKSYVQGKQLSLIHIL